MGCKAFDYINGSEKGALVVFVTSVLNFRIQYVFHRMLVANVNCLTR
jgi:hypothetical protein